MEHSFEVQHVDGKLNPADAPSRHPVDVLGDPTGARLASDNDPLQPPGCDADIRL